MHEYGVHIAKVSWGENVDDHIDCVHPPVPGVDHHRPERVEKTSKLDGHDRDGEEGVGHGQSK